MRFFLAIFILYSTSLFSQEHRTLFPDSLFSTYYHQRVSLFRAMPKQTNEVIFVGNSITEGGNWSELFNDVHVLNRGISGDITAGVMNRLDEIYSRKPSKVFLLIGINDLSKVVSTDSVVKNILFICQLLHSKSPLTKIFVQSILPVNDHFDKFKSHVNKQKEIVQVNQSLVDSAYSNYYEYLDIYSYFVNQEGNLKEEYTNDGLHLLAPAYLKWKALILDKVYDFPSLIPMPNGVNWMDGAFSLSDCSGIIIENDSLLKDAMYLKSQLANIGFYFSILKKATVGKNYINIRLGSSEIINRTAYKLQVTSNQIILKGSNLDGVFYGIQTLMQLVSVQKIKSCSIEDFPAFNWRGFMIDVGRNYQSVNQVLQQIEIMSKYKLNVFHFHLTEDIAWRLYSNKYPRLTDGKYMVRNKGLYYSAQDLKRIDSYCKDRHIRLLIEVDMPGHSEAFKRAMGVDMQSKEGTLICKEILNELCDNMDFEYIHIGGDEVIYNNKNFLNEIIDALQLRGKKVIAWSPGGEVKAGTILQMWNGNSVPNNLFPSIDSRHLYLNHFDPLEGVVTVFNHKIDDVMVGDSLHLGATLCNWPDRNVNKEIDLINMNAVYPIMLAFSERTWNGGGWINYKSDFDMPGTDHYFQFSAFENRLLNHKQLYFNKLPFPYVKQANCKWELIGPYNNNGNTLSQFSPELKEEKNIKSSKTVYGGTILLKHFWDPLIGSHLSRQKDSSTWYAKKIIWSNVDTVMKFWIGFNNFSRSTATHAPQVGNWDDKGSQVWVNDILVLPPKWANAGIKANLELSLIDENYESRPPTMIHFKKGPNTILLKCPVKNFKEEDWQNPVKWMFTFINTDAN